MKKSAGWGIPNLQVVSLMSLSCFCSCNSSLRKQYSQLSSVRLMKKLVLKWWMFPNVRAKIGRFPSSQLSFPVTLGRLVMLLQLGQNGADVQMSSWSTPKSPKPVQIYRFGLQQAHRWTVLPPNFTDCCRLKLYSPRNKIWTAHLLKWPRPCPNPPGGVGVDCQLLMGIAPIIHPSDCGSKSLKPVDSWVLHDNDIHCNPRKLTGSSTQIDPSRPLVGSMFILETSLVVPPRGNVIGWTSRDKKYYSLIAVN